MPREDLPAAKAGTMQPGDVALGRDGETYYQVKRGPSPSGSGSLNAWVKLPKYIQED